MRLKAGAGRLVAGLLLTQTVYAKDVTRQVIEQTQYDEMVADACRQYCQGNRSKGVLKRVQVSKLSAQRYRVTAAADFRNRHFLETTPGNGLMLFDFTVKLVLKGRLDVDTCRLTVLDIQIENDQLGLGELVRDEKGKIYPVEDCRRFL